MKLKVTPDLKNDLITLMTKILFQLATGGLQDADNIADSLDLLATNIRNQNDKQTSV